MTRSKSNCRAAEATSTRSVRSPASSRAGATTRRVGRCSERGSLSHGAIAKGLRAALGQGRFRTGFGLYDSENWEAAKVNATTLADRCVKYTGVECAVVDSAWMIGTNLWAPVPHFHNGVFQIHAWPRILAGFDIVAGVSDSWGAEAFEPDYPDALRAELARTLARENDFDKAARIASEIVNPDRRARSLTELASLQVERGRARDARATLVQAVAAAEEIPEGFPDVPASFRLESHESATVQDRAIRFARIAQVLGELLRYE